MIDTANGFRNVDANGNEVAQRLHNLFALTVLILLPKNDESARFVVQTLGLNGRSSRALVPATATLRIKCISGSGKNKHLSDARSSAQNPSTGLRCVYHLWPEMLSRLLLPCPELAAAARKDVGYRA
jgi:hypothetical protein